MIRRKSHEEYFIVGTKRKNGNATKERMIELGYTRCCNACGNTEWEYEGKMIPIPLQLDHKNGIECDDTLQNLWFLCPTCHSCTETWGSKNKVYKREILTKLRTFSTGLVGGWKPMNENEEKNKERLRLIK